MRYIVENTLMREAYAAMIFIYERMDDSQKNELWDTCCEKQSLPKHWYERAGTLRAELLSWLDNMAVDEVREFYGIRIHAVSQNYGRE